MAAFPNQELQPGIMTSAYYLGESGSKFSGHCEVENLRGVNVVIDGVKIWTVNKPSYYEKMKKYLKFV